MLDSDLPQAGEAFDRFGVSRLCSQHLCAIRGPQLPNEGVSPGRGADACFTVHLGRHETQSGSERRSCGVF